MSSTKTVLSSKYPFDKTQDKQVLSMGRDLQDDGKTSKEIKLQIRPFMLCILTVFMTKENLEGKVELFASGRVCIIPY